MTMELDKRSAEDLSQTRPGYGVIFMKVAEGDVRSIEFWPSTDGRLRTATFLPSEDLLKWIDNQYQESQGKGKEEASK